MRLPDGFTMGTTSALLASDGQEHSVLSSVVCRASFTDPGWIVSALGGERVVVWFCVVVIGV